jgi:hypothetical protein
MPSNTRRNILALVGSGVALGLTGGAIASTQPEETPFVVVNNQTNSDLSVTTRIRTAEKEDELVDATQTIPADGDQSYTDLVAGEPLLVTVRIDEGVKETYRWTSTAAKNALGVGITTDGIGFEAATPS